MSTTKPSATLVSKELDSIESKFPKINGEDWGQMHLCQFGACADGVERSCAKMKIKKGFHWSKCMPAGVGGPMPEGIKSCPKSHFGYMESGAMKVIMVETGEEKVVKGGEAYYVAPNHDAIVLEDTVMVEFESTAAEYYGKMTGKE